MIVCRPERAVPPPLLSMFERKGWWLQYKMNGTYTQVTVVDGVVTDTRGRNDEPHKAWRLTDESARMWRLVPRGKWVFVAELMHSKVPGIRDTHFVHDVIMADGASLIGTSYRSRWERLTAVFGDHVTDKTESHWVIDDNAWLARSYRPGSDYARLFACLRRAEHEGVVLKNPDGLLTRGAEWCVKCRLPNKNVSF